MIGVEFDMVVPDSRQALELYEKVFEVERMEVTDLSVGLNEAIFKMYGTRFHLLDENPEYHLVAPSEEHLQTQWCNIMVADIQDTYKKAMEAGCAEVQAITEIPEFGVSNAIFKDPFGYIWMLHQVHREVNPEEKDRMWEEMKKN